MYIFEKPWTTGKHGPASTAAISNLNGEILGTALWGLGWFAAQQWVVWANNFQRWLRPLSSYKVPTQTQGMEQKHTKIPWDENVHWKIWYHFEEVDFACRHGMYLMSFSESFWGYCDVELHVSTQGWLKMDGSPAALHSGHVSTLHGCPCWSSQYWCWCLRENMKDGDVGWCWDVGWNWGKLCWDLVGSGHSTWGLIWFMNGHPIGRAIWW